MTDGQHLDDVKDIKSTIIAFTLQHGPWAVLAVTLLAAELGWLKSPLMDSLNDHEWDAIERYNNTVQAINYNSAMLRAICLNLAKDQEQQVRCQPIFLKEYPPPKPIQ